MFETISFGDLVGRLVPDLDEVLTTLVVGHRTAVVEPLQPRRPRLVLLEDLDLARRGDDIGDGHRGARAGRPVETGLLERVEARGDLDLEYRSARSLTIAESRFLSTNSLTKGSRPERLVEQAAPERGLKNHRVDRALLADRRALRHRSAERRDHVGDPDEHPGLSSMSPESNAIRASAGWRRPGA